MGFLKRLLRGTAPQDKTSDRPEWLRKGASALLLDGDTMLEVKGESHRQDELRYVMDGMGREVHAILAPEPENQHDAHAVAVWVGGFRVGYLRREDAPTYQAAILRLMHHHGQPIALRGRVVGGEADRPSLGIWLFHDPGDFGIPPSSRVTAAPGRGADVLTGTAAAALNWAEDLPSDRVAAIEHLRKLLDHESNPLERHFIYNELEKLLYKCRDVFDSALVQFMQTCRSHDAEMEAIRPLLVRQLGGVPALPTYKQAAILKQKERDFEGALWWAERGLAIYGSEGLRADATADLQERAGRYRRKIGRAGAEAGPS